MDQGAPTDDQLRDAACLFATDKVGGAQMTAFKREARWRQHRWAVEELGLGPEDFGTHRGRPSADRRQPVEVPNGTKLGVSAADAGSNFLSQPVRDAVEQRLGSSAPYQTLDEQRLRRDLLSSMPMAFNLFGGAQQSERSRSALVDLFAPGEVGPVGVEFEWSPGRRNPQYTNDRTAFDVALVIGQRPRARTVVGIETKYHEHSTRETPPGPGSRARTGWEEQTAFLREIAEASGVFRSGWADAVLGTDLRQIWRDHLLALSMRRRPEWSARTSYALVFPRRNVSFADAARRYSEVLVAGDDSFRAIHLEDVVGVAFADDDDTGSRFSRRYLW